MNTPRTVILQLVSAVAIAGEILRAGALVEVTEAEAKDLLQRGKAVIHNEAPAVDDTEASDDTGQGDAADTESGALDESDASKAEQTPPQTEAKAEQPARRRNNAAK